jgi:prepilin-type N-terminal cleavage/methylation domain-containing protein
MTPPYQPPPGQQGNPRGFSLMEMIVAAAIFFVAMAGASTAIIGAIQISTRAAVRDALEAAVTLDLNWIRAYAKSWHCQTGPYASCLNITSGSALSSSALNYQPPYDPTPGSAYQRFATLCTNRNSSALATPAHQLLNEANGIASGSTNPPPPPLPIPATPGVEQAMPLSSSSLNAPDLAKSYRLYRQITVPADAVNPNWFNGNYLSIRYYTKSTDTPTLAFQRVASVFVEATSWCP